MNIRSLCCIFFILASINYAYSQAEIKVTGKVVDAANAGIEYVSVTMYSLDSGEYMAEDATDAEGKFELLINTPGSYYLSFQSIGYFDLEQDLDLESSIDLGSISLEIEDQTIQLEGAVITSERSVYKVELDKKVYDISQDPMAKSGSLSDALQNVPSVQVDTDGSVSVRGNSNVRILIDGKPSGMIGIEDPAAALQNIPAESVERIEVITNPSSRYEASGNAGIINIVLKKGRVQGINGSVSAFAGDPANVGFTSNFNYRKGKFNLFTGMNYRYEERPGGGESRITFLENGEPTGYRNSKTDRIRFGNNYGFQLGAEYFMDSRNTFGISANFRHSNGGSNADVFYDEFDAGYNPTNTISRFQREKEKENNLDVNFSYKHDFPDKPGHQLLVDIRASISKEDETANISEFATNTSDLIDNVLSFENQNTFVLSADYIRPFGEKGRFEIGMRADFQSTDSDFSVRRNEGGVWTDIDNFTAHIINNQNVHAAYVQYGQGIGEHFSFLAGLRMENSDISILAVDEETTTRKNYTDFFPTATLNYEFNRDNQLQVSYSRRIRRPMGFMLNPFFTYSDSRNTRIGNPDLNPTYTDSYELTYITNIKKLMITPSVYYSIARDNIQMLQTIDTQNEGDNLVTMPINIGNQERYGLDLTFTYKPLTWWNMMGNVNVFGYNTTGILTGGGINGEDISFEGNGTSWFGRFTSTFKLPWEFNFQVAGNGDGEQRTARNIRHAVYSLDLALTRDLFKGNGTITLNVRDLFNSRRRAFENFDESFESWNKNWRSVRTINVNFTYRFKQDQNKREQRKIEQEMNFEGDF